MLPSFIDDDEQIKIKRQVIASLNQNPKTGIYEMHLTRDEQIAMFIKYAIFLKQHVASSPRSQLIASLTKKMHNIIEFNECGRRLFDTLLTTEQKTNYVLFTDLLSKYNASTGVHMAGSLYNSYICLKKRLTYLDDTKTGQETGPNSDSNINKKKRKSDEISKSDEDKTEISYKKTCTKLIELERKMITDTKYNKWNQLKNDWIISGFNDLESELKNYERESSCETRMRGRTFEEYVSEHLIAQIVSKKCFIPINDLKIVRNVTIFMGNCREIDVLATQISTNKVVAIIEIKRCIYDIEYGYNQLTKIQSYTNLANKYKNIRLDDPTMNISQISDTTKYLLISKVPYSGKHSCASISVVRLMSSFIFDRFDDKVDYIGDLIEKECMTNEEKNKIWNVINYVRYNLEYKTDVACLIESLDANLIILPEL